MSTVRAQWAMLGAGVVIALAAACTPPPAAPPTPTTSSVYFPYPPRHDILEIAVPLDEPALSAARFALEANLADTMAGDNQPERVKRYNATVTAELAHEDTPGTSPPAKAETGGDTYRVVRATVQAADTVEVDICNYAVPGSWWVRNDGKTLGPSDDPNAYGLSRLTVQKTTATSADGQTPTQPRWLVTKQWIKVDLDPAQVRPICAPFKPSPWVQKMPYPTESSAPPTK